MPVAASGSLVSRPEVAKQWELKNKHAVKNNLNFIRVSYDSLIRNKCIDTAKPILHSKITAHSLATMSIDMIIPSQVIAIAL